MRFLLALLAVCIGAALAKFPLDDEFMDDFFDHQQQYDEYQLQPMPLTTSDYLKMKFGRHPQLDDPALIDFSGASIFDMVLDHLRSYPDYRQAVAIAGRTKLREIVNAQDLDSFTLIVPADFAIDQWKTRVGNVIARNITVLTDLAKSWIIPNIVLTRDACQDDRVFLSLSKNIKHRVNVYNNKIYLNGAHIFKGRRYSTDSIVLVTSSLPYPLLNKNAYDVLTAYPDYSKLAQLVRDAGLEDYLKNSPAITVFAPNNAAFSRLDAETSKKLTDRTFIRSLLKYHIVPGTLYKAAFGEVRQSYPSALPGKNIKIRNIDDNILINDDVSDMNSYIPRVTTWDVTITNGVIHGINNVIKIPK